MRLSLLLATCFLLVACGNYKEQKSSTPISSGKFNNATTTLDFATIDREIISKHCIQCHTHPGRHALYKQYNFVRGDASLILDRIRLTNSTKRMPAGGAPRLSKELIDMFAEWVEAGTPEFATDEGNLDEPLPNEPSQGTIGFKNFKERILKPYNCTACHAQYNDYGPVRRQLGSIVSLINDNKMPFPKRKNRPVKYVTPEDKEYILQWVADGAPERIGENKPIPKEKELKPTWLSLRNQVFGPKCILCHNSHGNRGGGNKQSFENFGLLRKWFREFPGLFNLKVTPENPSYGLLVESLERDDDDFLASRMPFNSDHDDVKVKFDRLSIKEIETIKKWIDLKLPYDEDEL